MEQVSQSEMRHSAAGSWFWPALPASMGEAGLSQTAQPVERSGRPARPRRAYVRLRAGTAPARVHGLLSVQPNRGFAVVSSQQLRFLWPEISDAEMMRRCAGALAAQVLKVELIGTVYAWSLGPVDAVVEAEEVPA